LLYGGLAEDKTYAGAALESAVFVLSLMAASFFFYFSSRIFLDFWLTVPPEAAYNYCYSDRSWRSRICYALNSFISRYFF